MYNTACVASAGRAVLEMIQYDWEPLSHGELEQRLDHAVEEILEADLIEKAKAQAGPTYLPQPEPPQHIQQSTLSPQPQQLEMPQLSQESQQFQESSNAQENIAVQYITDLLQNSDSSYNRSRLTGRARLSLRHTVILSLTLLCNRLSYRSVSSRFRVEKGNIHRIFFSFCERVNALADQQIQWPTGQDGEENLQSSSFLARTESSEQAGIPKVFGRTSTIRPLRPIWMYLTR
ncbi:hypothetical protein MATL_G00215660 [Megalops atlanticus]|uniref:Uncharacterized protein n=1 Tax=Megalops atlanticus TaxID=7932 RepID=A0A9D3PKD5_MEGAT|nr:hypothetical protein MATL_G00215660 [Megalops atlanticus]